MGAILLCVLWLLGGPSLATAQQARKTVTVDDLMALRTITDVKISPDGRTVAYILSTPSIKNAAHVPVLYVVPTEGGTPAQLTFTTQILNKPLPAARLRWSPDGSMLSFVALVDGVPQVVAMRASGGEARPLTSAREGVAVYEWAPDSRRIAFVAPEPLSQDALEQRRAKTYVIHFDREKRPLRLWVQSVAEGSTPEILTPAPQSVVDFSWSPDSSRIAYAASAEPGFYAQYRSRVYVVPSSGGTPAVVVDRPGMNRSPRFSPDGRWLAFVSSGGIAEMAAAEDLYVVSPDGRQDSIRRLTDDVWIGDYLWLPGGEALLYVATEQTNESGAQMFQQPVMRVGMDRRVDRITAGARVNYSLSLSRDGTRLAFRSVQARDMGDAYVMDMSSRRMSRLTEVNPELNALALGDLQPVSWRSFDGREIWGLLLTPPGYQQGTRVPTLVYCHGGPIGGFTLGLFPQFMHIPGQVDPYGTEAMAAAGMAVLFPMPRGGSGYGTKSFRDIYKSWGEADYKDIMAGVDAMVARGIADPDRLGVMGASYGGFMTSWIVTQTERFKAASTGASVNDLVQMYYLSDAGEIMAEYYGVPWVAGELLAAHSPITHAAKVSTPLLIQHGEEDKRVPLSQAVAFYRALKQMNKVVELDIYPRGGHVNYEPPLEREYMLRNLEWFRRWLHVEGTH